ncbi:hypothetical protein PAECIP111892_02001 [Paenibacillus auburnensis]|uniref:Uncharacterized protein n=1 Tax=Paenibacillus auburnensis TaxID=2905649 RepID=A0ABN8G551_9BACL|nr:hypothetical protein PAECIP111892_02001 [Paenibacillus auburnensis]
MWLIPFRALQKPESEVKIPLIPPRALQKPESEVKIPLILPCALQKPEPRTRFSKLIQNVTGSTWHLPG